MLSNRVPLGSLVLLVGTTTPTLAVEAGYACADAVAEDFATRLTEGLINKPSKKKASTAPAKRRQPGGRSR